MIFENPWTASMLEYVFAFYMEVVLTSVITVIAHPDMSDGFLMAIVRCTSAACYVLRPVMSAVADQM